MSKPPAETNPEGTVDDDNGTDMDALMEEAILLKQYQQEKARYTRRMKPQRESEINSEARDTLMASNLKDDVTVWSGDNYTPSSTKSPGLYPLRELQK